MACVVHWLIDFGFSKTQKFEEKKIENGLIRGAG